MNGLNNTYDWISGFRRGDLQAVQELFGEHHSTLLNFAERIIRDKKEAREIVMETFIKLLNRRSLFDNTADIKAFLYITVRNGCMDFLRFSRNGRTNEEPTLDPKESEQNFADDQVVHKANNILVSSIESLPAIVQQIFRLLFIEGMTTAVAARQLEIEQRDLLNHRKKGLHQLQTALDDNNLFSTPFFVHFLTVACRTFTAEKMPILK